MKLTLGTIAEHIEAQGEFSPGDEAQAYSIDSRAIQAGELFFAVTGERLNGHDFVAQAFEKGAAAAVVQRGEVARYSDRSRLLVVEDTLLALQKLATAVRKLWGRTLVGVTGSAGKTTTKEAIAHVLSTKYKVLKSEGNFNNHFGLPLMLLKLEPEHELAVVEMGMSHAGEISTLCDIAHPDIGVVTNVGAVHLEFFNSIADIARAKFELIESLPASGCAVLNADDEYVSQFGRGFRGNIITYGMGSTADVRAENVRPQGCEGVNFEVIFGGDREPAVLALIGDHNISNALAAVAVALELGLKLPQAVSALSALRAAEKRGRVLHLGNITIIDDCYNSNPKALAAMVEAMAAVPAQRRIVVAGEMLELGPAGEDMHRQSGLQMADKKIDQVIGVRGLAKVLAEGAEKAGLNARFAATPEEAGQWLAREAKDGDVILLKASRGVKLERALEVFQNEIVKKR